MLLIEAFSKSSATLFLLIDAHYCHISKRCKETQKEEMLELFRYPEIFGCLGNSRSIDFFVLFIPVQRGEGTKREIFRLFLPSDILCDIVSSCHLRKLSATIYFAILGPNSVLRSFPCHWSGPPVLPNSANAHPPPPPPTLPTPPQKRNKEDSSPPQKRKQRRQGWNYGIAN